MPLSYLERLHYLAWAAATVCHDRDRCCPACGGTNTFLVRRKYLFTSLFRCRTCDLRFRVPKDDARRAAEFYQETYKQGHTTDCPSDDALAPLIAKRFVGTEMDFSTYVEVLCAAGLGPGDAILDFGCSWGYGSWQLREAGFKVYSYEVSKPRASYAKKKLSCNVVESFEELQGQLKCVFSAHVIEHLPDPNLIWQIGVTVLSEGGFIACFCPNGTPELEQVYGSSRYHQLWGKVHPLVITPEFLQNGSAVHGCRARVYCNPYNLDLIAAGAADDKVHGAELCMIAVKSSVV